VFGHLTPTATTVATTASPPPIQAARLRARGEKRRLLTLSA
jgi:hypothetical protein